MASDSRLANDINEQFLVCKICYDVLRTPKTLGCLHTFCADCLDKHLDAESDRQSYRFTAYSRALSCPICRKKTEVPAGGVRRLPDNFLVASLAEIIGRKHLLHTGSKGCDDGPQCEICTSTHTSIVSKPAVARCLDCVKLLCGRCVDLHRRTKVTHSHSVIDMDVLNKDIACKVHADEAVRYYCETCEMCICVVCAFQEHKTHEVFSFGDSLDRCTRTLQPLVSKCRERIDEARRQLDAIGRCEKDIKTVEEQIRDSIMESMADIRRQERQLIQSIPFVYGEEGANFISEKDSLHEVIEGLLDAQAVADMLIREQKVELLFVRRDVEEKLKVLLQRRLGQIPELINRPIKFVPQSLHIGHLTVNDSDEQEVISHQGSHSLVSESVQTCELSTNDRIVMTTLSLLNCASTESQTETFTTSPEQTDNSASSVCSSEEEEDLVPTLDTPKLSSVTDKSALAEDMLVNSTSFDKILRILDDTFEPNHVKSFSKGKTTAISDKLLSNSDGKLHETDLMESMSLIKIVSNSGEVVGCLHLSKEYLKNKFNVSSANVVRLDELLVSNATNGLSTKQNHQTTKHCDRSSSPVAELLGNYSIVVNDGQRAVHVSLSNSAAVRKVTNKDAQIGTEIMPASDKSCSPIRVPHPSIGVMASCATSNKSSQSIVDTADVETEVRAATAEQGTSMPQVTLMNRETSTPVVHLMHKNLGTDSQEMCDKQTSTIDVTAGYKDAVAKRGLVFVNRGTNTAIVSIRHRETSPPPVGWTCVDRASSPVRLVTMVDKGISAKKGEILEPVDVFYSPGGSKMPSKTVDGIRRSATNSPRSPKPPKLESIQEDSLVEHQQLQSGPEVSPVRPPILRHSRNSLPFNGGHHSAPNRSPRRISDPLGKAYELDGDSAQRRLLFEERVFFPPSFTLDQTRSKDQQQAASSSLSDRRPNDESQHTIKLQPPPALALPSTTSKVPMEDKAVSTDGLLQSEDGIEKLQAEKIRLEQQPIRENREEAISLVTPINLRRFSLPYLKSSQESNKVLTKDSSVKFGARLPSGNVINGKQASLSKIDNRGTANSVLGHSKDTASPSKPNTASSVENVGTINSSVNEQPGGNHKTVDQTQPHAQIPAADDKPKQDPKAETLDTEAKVIPTSTDDAQNLFQEKPSSVHSEKDILLSPSKPSSSSDRHRKLSPFRKGRRSPATSPAPGRKNGMGGLASLQRMFSAATHGSGKDTSNGTAKFEEQKAGGIFKKFYR